MPWWWWVATTASALVGGAILALVELCRAREVAQRWATAGLTYGSVWPSVVGHALLGAMAAFAVANFVSFPWLD